MSPRRLPPKKNPKPLLRIETSALMSFVGTAHIFVDRNLSLRFASGLGFKPHGSGLKPEGFPEFGPEVYNENGLFANILGFSG